MSEQDLRFVTKAQLDSKIQMLRQEILKAKGSGSGGGASFVGLSDTPSSFSGKAGQSPQVNSSEDALEFGVTPLEFLDNFDDEDIFWPWVLDNTATGKTITEANDVLSLHVSYGYDGRFEATNNYAPKAILGIPDFPITITWKQSMSTVNNKTNGGMAFSSGIRVSQSYYAYVGRVRDDSASRNGITFYSSGAGGHHYLDITSNPLWFKVQIPGSYTKVQWTAFYSINGTDWTEIATVTNPVQMWDGAIALFAGNGQFYSQVDIDVDWVKITRNLGAG